jgi:hypothetical protein
MLEGIWRRDVSPFHRTGVFEGLTGTKYHAYLQKIKNIKYISKNVVGYPLLHKGLHEDTKTVDICHRCSQELKNHPTVRKK